jgi:hypothetical protein
MAAILIGGLLIATSPGFVEPVPEAILIRTDGSLGTFTATGDAVDSGRICGEGVFFDQRPDSPPRSPGVILLESRLVCLDGGPDFRIRGEIVESDERFNRSEGVWRVVRFRGTDANLEGEGRLFTSKVENEVVSYLITTYIGEVTLSP